jgi:hypothetical protein
MASALQSLSLLVEVQNRAQEASFPEEFARVISRDCIMAVINKCRSKETPRGVESAPLTPPVPFPQAGRGEQTRKSRVL